MFIKETLFEKHYRNGIALYDNGKYEAALKEYSRALEKIPDVDELFYNRGLCYYALEKYEHAVVEYTKAIEITPNDIDFLFARAMAHTALEYLDLALDDISQVLKLDNKHDKARLLQANIYLDQDNISIALEEFVKLAESSEHITYVQKKIIFCQQKLMEKNVQN